MSVTISGSYIHHVRKLYGDAQSDILRKLGVRHKLNGITQYGLSAYPLAVASVEAFINEMFLGQMPRAIFHASLLWNLPESLLDFAKLSDKILMVPQFLFQRTLDKGKQPYQDMQLLIQIRNDLIHYKMETSPPKYISHLSDRNIVLALPKHATGCGDYTWPDKLNCSEGVRWAHNTACKLIHELVFLTPSEYRQHIEGMASNFTVIEDSEVENWFRIQGIDQNSHHPEKFNHPKAS